MFFKKICSLFLLSVCIYFIEPFRPSSPHRYLSSHCSDQTLISYSSAQAASLKISFHHNKLSFSKSTGTPCLTIQEPWERQKNIGLMFSSSRHMSRREQRMTFVNVASFLNGVRFSNLHSCPTADTQIMYQRREHVHCMNL